MPDQLEFTLRHWIDFNPAKDDNINIWHKEWEVLNGVERRIGHEHVKIPVWGLSNRSLIVCYQFMH